MQRSDKKLLKSISGKLDGCIKLLKIATSDALKLEDADNNLGLFFFTEKEIDRLGETRLLIEMEIKRMQEPDDAT